MHLAVWMAAGPVCFSLPKPGVGRLFSASSLWTSCCVLRDTPVLRPRRVVFLERRRWWVFSLGQPVPRVSWLCWKLDPEGLHPQPVSGARALGYSQL